MDVHEENKLIMEFLGMRKDKISSPYYYDQPNGRYYDENETKYHTSWDWLMPVVGKVCEIFFIDFEGYGGFDMEYMMGDSELGWHLKMANISQTHNIIVKAIKWINERQ